jgi:(1->4)-alpha-D-glucan 1-alpha-D-glucosylmutase
MASTIPSEYLRRLRETADCYIVVEKILEQRSPCADWPVSGTTGYDFINALGSTMVNRRAGAHGEHTRKPGARRADGVV